MSVPPLVCSTPPPPDHCEDDVEDDEFSFQYTGGSLSPSNQFDTDKFSYDTTYNEKANRDTQDSSHLTNKIEETPKPAEKIEKLNGCKNEQHDNPRTAEFQNAKTDFEEDNNIEDLDLKLDSLQIDFQNGKETVEDSLNANFDNFGTFFGSSTLNDSPETSYYLPKIDDVPNSETYEKEPKSQETLSDASVSIQNEDSSDIDVAIEIPHDSVQTTLEISSCITEVLTLEKEPISALECSFSQFTSAFSDAADDNIDDIDIPDENACSNCIDVCACSDSAKEENVTNAFAVDWNENQYKTAGNDDIQANVDDFPLASDDDSKDIVNGDANAEIDSGLDLFTSFDKKDDGNDDLDDFDDFATFHSVEVSDVSSSNAFQAFDIEISKEKVDLGESPVDENVESHSNVNSDPNDPVSRSDDEDDDFGDFDAYNPTDKAKDDVVKSNVENDFAVNEFLFGNDSSATEQLNLAIKSIFAENAESEGNSEFSNSSLELNSTLGESWNHLVNYEAEQSYLFPWNNSASQKSLLKSLGIDSRNILFGPKWNSNMPRFAANLGSNPLQPIKHTVNQSAPEHFGDRKSSIGNEPAVTVTPPNKDYDWDNGSNLASTDFQASSYAESLLLDLEHLMATLDQMTSGQSAHFKISDLFSNACNERGDEAPNVSHSSDVHSAPEESGKVEKPLHPTVLNIGRKINLPDTHIFTPTDSETPWSHTIHYNDENYNDFHSATSKDSKIINSDGTPDPRSEKFIVAENADDFDDFQCHKIDDNPGFDDVNSKIDTLDILNAVKSTITGIVCDSLPVSISKEESDDFGDFQTADATFSSIPKFTNNSNLLEPVKITPSAPVVNWPEPGEVKSLDLDDFNDFSSASFSQAPPNININSVDSFVSPPTDITYLPNLATGPKLFILKESKIESSINSTDNTQTEPIQTYVNDKNFSSIKMIMSQNQIVSDSDGFSDFVSNVDSKKDSIQINVDKNLTPQMNTSRVDEFDDFQSANFVPPMTDYEQKEIHHVLASENHIVFQSKPDLKPSSNYTSYYDKPLEPTTNRRQSIEPSSKNSSQQILQPLSLENFSQINWPNPGMDIQDLTRFNPVNSIKSYSEPKDNAKNSNSTNNEQSNDDDWSDFVSIKPTTTSASVKPMMPNMLSCNGFGIANVTNSNIDDSEDWSDFVSSATTPKNNSELKTISQNIHSQSTINTPSYAHKNPNVAMTRTKPSLQNNVPSNVNILPNLTYVSPKANMNKSYNNHFQNL